MIIIRFKFDLFVKHSEQCIIVRGKYMSAQYLNDTTSVFTWLRFKMTII